MAVSNDAGDRCVRKLLLVFCSLCSIIRRVISFLLSIYLTFLVFKGYYLSRCLVVLLFVFFFRLFVIIPRFAPSSVDSFDCHWSIFCYELYGILLRWLRFHQKKLLNALLDPIMTPSGFTYSSVMFESSILELLYDI